MKTSHIMNIAQVSKTHQDGATTVSLKHDGWTYSTDENVKIASGIIISMKDEFQPDWDTHYYVTVESIPLAEINAMPGDHYSDKTKAWLDRRIAKDAGAAEPTKPGRMFRK